MKKNASHLILVLTLFLLTTTNTFGQIALKNSDLKDYWNMEWDMEKLKPQNLRYKDGTLLKKGNYIFDSERGGLIVSFYVNDSGQIDGALVAIKGLPPLSDLQLNYRNDTLVKYERKKEGVVVQYEYLEGDTFYKKEYDEQEKLLCERRYRNGESIYSKGLNPSGWIVDDEVKGIREWYSGESNIVFQRETYKNLQEGITQKTEEFDEKGNPERTKIYYKDSREKTISSNGHYEIYNPKDGFIYKYSNKGKLLKKTKLVSPMIIE
ncbi:hypothetical protein [Pinibacter soli]|uniref:Toxin-antitoxin system YwqK family antitoxin n=1 Tax=Pinibacter soli TaxID=3044211 RepID=A0ABT6RFS7_9BACT|nr:hypothetical protein [Pinibacter soli]MDI3321431.1 hypothetical protein [Pinibacter soli]